MKNLNKVNQIVNDYFTNRTKDLEDYYNKFCSEKERGFFPQMLSEMYIHVIDKLDKLSELILRDELHFYCIQYIYNQRNWRGTKFKEEIEVKESNEGLLLTCEILVDHDYESEQQLLEESEEYDKRLEQVNKGYLKLTNSQKVLYQKYFVERQSMRKIAKEVGVSATAIFNLIKQIKSVIIETEV